MSNFRPYFLAEPGKPFPEYETYNKKNYVPPKSDSIIKKTKDLGSAVKKDILQIETSPKEYKSTWTNQNTKSYKSWLKNNYPTEYYKKYGGKTKDTLKLKRSLEPFKNLKTVGKLVRGTSYLGIAEAVYEGVKYALGTGNIPSSIDERENIRRLAFDSALSTITYNDKGEANQVLPDYKKVMQTMKDHKPFKKYIRRQSEIFPKMQTKNVNFKSPDYSEKEGLDYIWVDPMDSMWGDPANHPEINDYKLTEYGYVRKGD